MSRGALALVLHTHMPYVEGFGTWPFGEEWLWEAVATCYLPLLDVLDSHPDRVTLSLTPVLCDQLEAPGALERCLAFLREVRLRADLAQERLAARERARRLELVAEHGRHRQRHAVGRGVQHVEQRQVARGDRLPQPLLAERPRAESLHVRHVGVEDEGERAGRAAHGRRTASRSSARSSSPRRNRKSRSEIAGLKRS